MSCFSRDRLFDDLLISEGRKSAKEKVLQNRKSYNITEEEVAFLKESIKEYRRKLNEIQNQNR